MGPRTRPVTSHVHQVGGLGLTGPQDAAQYLVHWGGQAVLIDAGCGDRLDRLLVNLASLGVSPDQVHYLLLTHCHYDHSGGAAELRRRFGWRVGMHALDAPYLETGDDRVSAANWYGQHLTPCPVDLRLTGGERLPLGELTLQVLHIPGHSPGSAAFLVESDQQRVLFGQDLHGPLHPALLSNRDQYQQSLRTLLALDADILCEGHHGIMAGKDSVAQFIDRYLED